MLTIKSAGAANPAESDINAYRHQPVTLNIFVLAKNSESNIQAMMFGGTAEPKEQSGLRSLLTGLAVFLACLLVSCYFVVFEIPCVLADFDQRNAPLPEHLSAVNRAAPFILNNWFVFAGIGLALLVVTQWRSTDSTKRRVCHWIGIGTGITSVTFTVWLAWATLSQAGWKLLYSY
ncbi:hypothetical protein OAF34_03040 [Pirellulaceae bacterium]|nr:hypothetical protein [Pirellulaceae bacterium]